MIIARSIDDLAVCVRFYNAIVLLFIDVSSISIVVGPVIILDFDFEGLVLEE